ncbi:MAG TPA: hypothetical protein VFF43_09080, partial [Caldimonas sp.]|nr:hypothetical protein [Caldimonas sp.]
MQRSTNAIVTTVAIGFARRGKGAVAVYVDERVQLLVERRDALEICHGDFDRRDPAACEHASELRQGQRGELGCHADFNSARVRRRLERGAPW